MDNKIAILKIPSFKVETKMYMAVILIEFICILKSITLSKTEKYILAHFMCEGYNQITREQVIEGKLVSNKKSLTNVITRFRRAGILRKDGVKEYLSPDFSLPITSKLKIDIMLDNT